MYFCFFPIDTRFMLAMIDLIIYHLNKFQRSYNFTWMIICASNSNIWMQLSLHSFFISLSECNKPADNGSRVHSKSSPSRGQGRLAGLWWRATHTQHHLLLGKHCHGLHSDSIPRAWHLVPCPPDNLLLQRVGWSFMRVSSEFLMFSCFFFSFWVCDSTAFCDNQC